jgi:acyl carrier protein
MEHIVNNDEILKLVKDAMVYADPQKAAQHSELSLNDSLSDLGIDSIAALEMAAALEEKLGMQFPDDALSAVVDVRGFVQLVQRHVGVVSESWP